MEPILRDFLAARGARYEVVTHKEAPTSQEEAAAAHVSGWTWAKVVLVKDATGFALAVLPAACEIDLARLGGLIGRGPAALASVEEVLAVDGDSELGALAPFGDLIGVPTLLDSALLEGGLVTMPAGDHRTAIRMRPSELVRLARARTGHFAVHPAQGFPVHAGRRAAGRRAR